MNKRVLTVVKYFWIMCSSTGIIWLTWKALMEASRLWSDLVMRSRLYTHEEFEKLMKDQLLCILRPAWGSKALKAWRGNLLSWTIDLGLLYRTEPTFIRVSVWQQAQNGLLLQYYSCKKWVRFKVVELESAGITSRLIDYWVLYGSSQASPKSW